MQSLTTSVYTLFFVEDPQDPQILLIQREGKQGWSVPSSKITDDDAYSGVFASARTTIEKIGNIDIRELSLNRIYDYSAMVNWEAYELAKVVWNSEQDIESLKLTRNPFNWMLQKLFTNSHVWNDDEEQQFIYFVPIEASDLQIIQNQANKGTQIKLQPLSSLEQFTLSTKTAKFIQNFNLSSLIQSKVYEQLIKTYIYIGFKLPGFEKFNAPRPFLHTFALFDGLYRRRSEKWLQFNFPDGEVPSEELLSTASAIILPGSGCSAYDEHLWIKKFEKFLVDTYNQHKHIKFLTICFGLQVIIQAFGGKVEPLEKRKLDRNHHLFGNESLAMNVDEFKNVKCFQDFKLQDKMVINKAHGDEVSVVPEMFINLGTSDNCRNEVLISTDHRIFGYQGHPEYSNEQQKLMHIGFTSFIYKRNIQDVMLEQTNSTAWSMGLNDKIHRDLCIAFIKN